MTPSAAASRPRASPRATIVLLLPERTRLEGDTSLAPQLMQVLARGDARNVDAGAHAQLLRHWDVLPRGLPVAALTRDLDCSDAEHATWLRADPAHVRADMGAGRLMACGELGLSRDEAEALVRPLRPLFGDAGFPISVGSTSRWYLMLPRDARLPTFPAPERVLGDDIFSHLPQGDEGRRWRRLLNEAQVLLHNHPVNEARIARGQFAVNSLWFHGGGSLPDHVRAEHAAVRSDEPLLRALARRAGTAPQPLPERCVPEGAGQALFDLRGLDSLAVLERDWIAPALAAVRHDEVERLCVDGVDGFAVDYRRGHRWRLWRRPPRAVR